MVTDTRLAREREGMARAARGHLEAAEGIDAAHMGAEEAVYTEPVIDPQWMIAYKLFTDDQGEYGIPYPVPIGQFTQGANALVNMRRRDGGFAWTAVKPERVAPPGELECPVETCGDAHLGGRRKRLPSLYHVVEHVASAHWAAYNRDKAVYDEISKGLADDNPRLRVLRERARLAQGGTVVSDLSGTALYCRDDECTRFFDTEQGRDTHERSHKKGE